jgi:hypothetical protein
MTGHVPLVERVVERTDPEAVRQRTLVRLIVEVKARRNGWPAEAVADVVGMLGL